jgi:hypothetical protein
LKLHLTGPQLGRIRKAIVQAYGGAGANALDDLNLALTDHLENRTVYHLVAIQSPFPIQVGQLLARANGEGWLPSLLGAIQQDKPDAAPLQDLVRSFIATASARQVLDVAAGSGAVAAGVRAELQRMLPGGAIVKLDTMQRRLRTVCRVDYADLSPPGLGTGFLVGADLVLTNWHNLKRVIEAPRAAQELRFRFDLLESAAAADNAGRVSRAKANGSPVLRWSPAAGVELPGGTGEPTMQELDYALARLEERVAEDPAPGGGTRGYVGLKKTIPMATEGSSVMVLQHPLRGELQFAIGTALGPNETGSRLRHTASTQNGSSGSPVFDAALAPIALHNGARSGTVRVAQEFNTAVPLAHIVAHLTAGGVIEMLEQ